MNEAEARLDNMFCSCHRQTTLGIAINLPSHSSQINSHSFMQHHWHLNVMWCRNWAFNLKPVNFYSKIKLVLKRSTSGIKILGDFESKYLCRLRSALCWVHMGSSGLKKPQHSTQVMCSVRQRHTLEFMHVKFMHYRVFFLHTFSDQIQNWGSSANENLS